jgi:hypothetical protein
LHNQSPDGVGEIFGIRFKPVTPSSGRGDEPPEPDLTSARRRRRWKRTLFLVCAFVLLFFAAVVERGHPAISKARQAGIIAALADPLSLFAERSPGERGGGALLSTKPPHERVLSEVRDRDPSAGDPPADPGFAVTPEDLAALPGGAPGAAGAPGDPGGDPLGNNFFAPPFPGGPGGPPFLPAAFGGPPGGPPPSGPIPPVIDPPGAGAVPEPATWAMLILGFFAVGAAIRRRERRKPA